MKEKYKGMTINERLYLSGLMDDFDQAIKKKDNGKIIEILSKVDIKDSDSIQNILQSLKKN